MGAYAPGSRTARNPSSAGPGLSLFRDLHETAEQQALFKNLFDGACTTIDCTLGLDFEETRVSHGVASGRLAIDAAALDRGS